jgi:hypothetical protein
MGNKRKIEFSEAKEMTHHSQKQTIEQKIFCKETIVI